MLAMAHTTLPAHSMPASVPRAPLSKKDWRPISRAEESLNSPKYKLLFPTSATRAGKGLFDCRWWLFLERKGRGISRRREPTLSHTAWGCVKWLRGRIFYTSLCWSKPKSAGQDSSKSLPWGGTRMAEPALILQQRSSPALPWPLLETECTKGTEMHRTGRGRGKVRWGCWHDGQPEQTANKNGPFQRSTREKNSTCDTNAQYLHHALTGVEGGTMKAISRKRDWCRLYFTRPFPFACTPAYTDYSY